MTLLLVAPIEAVDKDEKKKKRHLLLDNSEKFVSEL